MRSSAPLPVATTLNPTCSSVTIYPALAGEHIKSKLAAAPAGQHEALLDVEITVVNKAAVDLIAEGSAQTEAACARQVQC